MADNVSLKIWNAIEPLVNRKIEEQTRNCQRMKSMTVSTAYSAQTGVVGVTEAFGKEIFLPVISTIDTGKLTVGANVWVAMPYSSMSNAIVTMMGDGKNGQTGNVAEITATELTGKSAADRAAMYSAGSRLLKVMNGDTEVLLGLDADGSTKWLGTNKPLRNLLDNSDFTNSVNQRGQNSYIGNGYTIDRWYLWGAAGDATFLESDGYIALNNKTSSIATFSQTFEKGILSEEKQYTLAYEKSNGEIISKRTEFLAFYDEKDTCQIAFNQWLGIKWAALYEGSYTADTLPPYVPKGYAAELAECMRYYRKIKIGSVGKGNYIGLAIPISPQMRINPTATLSGEINTNNGTTQLTAGSLTAHTDYIRMDAYTDISDFNWWFAEYILSADL